MKVEEIARSSGVSADTVRYYHKLGLLEARRDPFNRYRRFEISTFERLRFVLSAKQHGFTLAEIREIFELSRAGKSPCPRVRDLVRERAAENAKRIAELQRLQRRLESAQRRWAREPDRLPDGDGVCHLIESFAADSA
jgi:DNA-binding transcriptional MerR regulator